MFDELAGIVGVDPARLTFRQLVRMVEGREKAHWWHTAMLIAALANCHRAKNAQPANPRDFHPYYYDERRQPARLTKKTFSALWAACGGK